MVNSMAGLRDFLIQRVSAVLLVIYTVFLVSYLVWHAPIDYMAWHGLFAYVPMKIATLLCLAALLLHAWVGMWTIATDYLKAFWVRFLFEIAVFLTLIACFFYGLLIVWGV